MAEAPIPEINSITPLTEKPIKKECKEHNLKLDKDTYLLKMELENETIHFQIRQTNSIYFYYYSNEFNYDQLLTLLKLSPLIFNDISKIFNFYETGFLKKKN
jgi:hypothetical protein